MGAVTDALYEALAADATLVALLNTYDPAGPDPERPAIFSGSRIPGDAQEPYVILDGEVGQDPILDANGAERGREVVYQIRCYTVQDETAAPVEAIAERIRAVLHRQTFAVSGYTLVDCRISGPIVNNEEDLDGRVLNARLLLDGP